MPSIRAIIANGKLLNVPVWILMITAVFGVVMIYFGAIIIQFSIFNKKVKSILTKPFWFNWHPYNPD
jgi:RsiW-degrading membrane proteinase PrsW (M82 family)